MVKADFHASLLGTKEYWDKVYQQEVKNFQETNDIGEVWFGEESVAKMIQWIEDHDIPNDARILDLGCGNGYFLIELNELGYSNLIGCDYSEAAIQLAESIHSENIQYKVCDILNEHQVKELGKFHLLTDKGTFDAIALMPLNGSDEPDRTAITKYLDAVHALLEQDGILLITSCNWTDKVIQLIIIRN